MLAIRKFNKYCEQLEVLYKLEYAIPLPVPLPTKLADLHGDQTLLQDIWITCSSSDIPWWLGDSDVCEGIRALLKWDRCREEQCHLGVDADNMCHWYGIKLSAVELALWQCECKLLFTPSSFHMLNHFKIPNFSFFYSIDTRRCLRGKNYGQPPLPLVSTMLVRSNKLSNSPTHSQVWYCHSTWSYSGCSWWHVIFLPQTVMAQYA